MNRHKPVLNRITIATCLTAIFVALILINCSEETSVERYKNQPPRVWINSGPPEGSLNNYEITFSWGGWDPDGKVAHFEYAITDNEGAFDPADTTFAGAWAKTRKTEDTFIFSADQLVDSIPDSAIEEFQRSHTFFVRAVDNEGAASPQPAYRSFTARTLSPRVMVTIPSGSGVSQVPRISTFYWTAVDYVDDLQTTQDPESVSWILEPTEPHDVSYEQTLEYIRSLPVNDSKWNEWGGWTWYGAPQDAGKSWTTPLLADGCYVFAIRAKDEAGAITPVFDTNRNVRNMQVAPIVTGPRLTVRNNYWGPWSTVLCKEPLRSIYMPEGVPVRFCWDASAEYYGGTVAGYRYGWDIDNLDDPDEWEIGYTLFTSSQACSPARTFFNGPHRFTVEIIDTNGLCSRIEILVDIVQAIMDRNLLVIDDFTESEQIGWNDPYTPGLQPSDQEHDAFWETVLEDVEGFFPGTHVLQVSGRDDLWLDDLLNYKSIIWSVYQFDNSLLQKYVRFHLPDGSSGSRDAPNLIALYMEAGGHILICGHQPVSAVINPMLLRRPRFPLIFKHELAGYGWYGQPGQSGIGSESFAYKDLCLETMGFAYNSHLRRRDPYIVLFVCPDDGPPLGYTLRDHTMRAAIPADTWFRFPRLELREEAAGAGRWHRPDKQGLDVEVYDPPYFLSQCLEVPPFSRSCFQPIYGVEMLDSQDENYGSPVAFWTSVYADRIADVPGAVAARSAVFGFPPVYFEPDSVKAALEVILFDEWKLPRK